MKYRVLKFFIDRDTLQEFNAGDLFPCDNLERAKELIYKGYIERLQEELKQEEKPAKAKEPAKPKTAKAKSTTVKKTASKKKA